MQNEHSAFKKVGKSVTVSKFSENRPFNAPKGNSFEAAI